MTMPSPVPCNTRVTEARILPSPRVVLSRGSSVLRPAPTPSAPPWTSVWPYTRTCSASIDRGCGRVSPVRRSAFAACRLLYAGAVPGCSRFDGPDCCLRLTGPGSARSVPHGIYFRRGRVRLSLRPAASLLLASPPGSHRTPEVDFRAPLAACPGGTHTRRLIGAIWATLRFDNHIETSRRPRKQQAMGCMPRLVGPGGIGDGRSKKAESPLFGEAPGTGEGDRNLGVPYCEATQHVG